MQHVSTPASYAISSYAMSSYAPVWAAQHSDCAALDWSLPSTCVCTRLRPVLHTATFLCSTGLVLLSGLVSVQHKASVSVCSTGQLQRLQEVTHLGRQASFRSCSLLLGPPHPLLAPQLTACVCVLAAACPQPSPPTPQHPTANPQSAAAATNGAVARTGSGPQMVSDNDLFRPAAAAKPKTSLRMGMGQPKRVGTLLQQLLHCMGMHGHRHMVTGHGELHGHCQAAASDTLAQLCVYCLHADAADRQVRVCARAWGLL